VFVIDDCPGCRTVDPNSTAPRRYRRPVADQLTVTIEGFEMPGRSCAPDDAGETYENVHVGVQRKQDPVDLIPGDKPTPTWTFRIDVRPPVDGAPDFGGPYVHGRRGERFLYLTWGTVAGEVFHMFRRAKLVFADCPDEALADALDQGGLHIRVRMRDGKGNPRCARVRDAEWRAFTTA
jgi:hypothetical protein